MVRFPSGQETEFGGQAAYLMRIFGIDGDTVTEKGLENTPDTKRLAADAALKERLADYVRANTAAIDVGVYEVPDEFLARKVISWSTFGSVRRANHPFTETLSPESFADLDFAPLRLVKSPQALIERLDNGTCQGCHQAGSTAGFHFIGRDDKSTSPLNRIEVGVSPHFHAEQPRRVAWLHGDGRGSRARKIPAAVLRAACRLERRPAALPGGRRRHAMHDGRRRQRLCRRLVVRAGHRLHADRQRHRDVA